MELFCRRVEYMWLAWSVLWKCRQTGPRDNSSLFCHAFTQGLTRRRSCRGCPSHLFRRSETGNHELVYVHQRRSCPTGLFILSVFQHKTARYAGPRRYAETRSRLERRPKIDLGACPSLGLADMNSERPRIHRGLPSCVEPWHLFRR